MKKQIVHIVIIGLLSFNHHIQTMIRVTQKLQQPAATKATQAVTSSTFNKFIPKSLPATYNYGKKQVNSTVNSVLQTWRHPLYTDFFEPLYVGLELQHGWMEKKYQQIMWLQSQINKQSENKEETSKSIRALHIPTEMINRYEKAMKRYEYFYKLYKQNLDNFDDFFVYKQLEDATNNLYFIMTKIQELLAKEITYQPVNTTTQNFLRKASLSYPSNADYIPLILATSHHLKSTQLIPDKKPYSVS